jgi:serine phosphatase RsbU (regulator of sigma subunit)
MIFGEEGLKRVLRECAHLEAKGIEDHLLTRISTFTSGMSQHDDQTMVIVKIKPFPGKV